MLVKERELKGVFEIELKPIEDNRGFFMRSYDDDIFMQFGLNQRWVHENHSYSKKQGTLRGLHFQFPPKAEVKLIRATAGELFIVFVDIRKTSPTLGQWENVIISETNKKMLYLPEGFALGMCTLVDNCTLLYKMGNYYAPEQQGTIKWDDPDIGINWPIYDPIISEKDSLAGSFGDFLKQYGGLDV